MARGNGLTVRLDTRERKALDDKGIDVPNGDGGLREETASETARRVMGLVPYVPAEGAVRLLDAFYVLEGLTDEAWVELVRRLPQAAREDMARPVLRAKAQAALCRRYQRHPWWTLWRLAQTAKRVAHDEAWGVPMSDTRLAELKRMCSTMWERSGGSPVLWGLRDTLHEVDRARGEVLHLRARERARVEGQVGPVALEVSDG